MIAQRFRPLGWIAGVATAACALYMISLQVASERGRLEEIDHKIANTKREIRQLQTELGTRASLRQLERWNAEVLALSAPVAGQYLPGEAALSGVDRGKLGDEAAPPPPVMMAVLTPEATRQEPPKPAPTLVARLTTPAAAPKPMTKADRAVQAAIAPKPDRDAIKVAMLDRRTLGDLALAAKGEATRGKTRP